MIPYTDGQARTIARGQAEIAQAISNGFVRFGARVRALVVRMLEAAPPGPHL